MDTNFQAIMDVKLDHLRKNLELRRFQVSIVEDAAGAVRLVKDTIAPGSSVGLGGSMTLEQTGILAGLRTMDIKLQDRYAPGLTSQQKQEVLRQGFSADYFLCSANAISMDGRIYNVDGNGSRTAATIFGPSHVIMVVGTNKIVPDEAAAIQRIKDVAAPVNCQRLGRNTPCRQVGHCVDCMVDQSICAAWVRLDRSSTPQRIHLVIIRSGQWGY